MNRHRMLPLVVTVGILSISTAAPLIKLCDEAAPAVIAAARLGLSTLLLAPSAFLLHRRGRLRFDKRRLPLLLLAGVFLAAHFYFWISSLKQTSVLSSVVIVTTNPIFVGIASWILFAERLRRNLVVAIFIAGAGGAIIALSDHASESTNGAIEAGAAESEAAPSPLHGDLLALAGAVMASAYFLVGRRLRQELDTMAYVVPVYGTAALLLTAYSLAAGLQFTGLSPMTYLWFILLATIPQLVGHGSLNWALKYLPATTVAIFVLGEPIGASVLAFTFLHEPVTRWQLAGGVLILLGIAVAARGPASQSVARAAADSLVDGAKTAES